jgi:hypothetical protein
MPFVSDEQIGKEQQKQDFMKKVEVKQQQQRVIQKANKKPPNQGLSEDEMMKLYKTPKQKAPPKVTFKDIETQLKVVDLIETRKEDEINKLLEDQEVKEIKSEIVGVLALPHTHPDKRKIFHHLLNSSGTVNDYVDSNVIFRLFNKANNHIKFGTVYALKFVKTQAVYSQLLREQQEREQVNAQAQAPAQAPAPQQVPENNTSESTE